MGSLLPGWNRKKSGPPKAMRDFEEPSKIPSSPRAAVCKPVLVKSNSGPPNLSRNSCPPTVLHGTVCPPPQKGGEPIPIKVVVTERPKLARSSLGSPISPRSPFSSSLPAGNLFNKLLEKNEEDERPSGWCDRVDSSALNVRPDVGDLDTWRHGKFQPDDPMHSMHILDVESPKEEDEDKA